MTLFYTRLTRLYRSDVDSALLRIRSPTCRKRKRLNSASLPLLLVPYSKTIDASRRCERPSRQRAKRDSRDECSCSISSRILVLHHRLYRIAIVLPCLYYLRVGWKRSGLLLTASSALPLGKALLPGNADPVRTAGIDPCLSFKLVGATSLLVELTEEVEPILVVVLDGATRVVGRGRPFDARPAKVADGAVILDIVEPVLPTGLETVVVEEHEGIVEVRDGSVDELLPVRDIGSRPAAICLPGAVTIGLSVARAGTLC